MSGEVATLMLICAGNPLPPASSPPGDVGVIRVPVNAAMAEAFKGEPPVGRLKVVGEPQGQPEWIVSGSRDVSTGSTMILRLRKPQTFAAFSFQAGRIKDAADGQVSFEKLVEGSCFYRSTDKTQGQSK